MTVNEKELTNEVQKMGEAFYKLHVTKGEIILGCAKVICLNAGKTRPEMIKKIVEIFNSHKGDFKAQIATAFIAQIVQESDTEIIGTIQ